jgi:hypothetical protein
MTQYLVAVHHPDDYDPSVAEDEAMSRNIDALNDEMKAAGVRIFVGPETSARASITSPCCTTARAVTSKPSHVSNQPIP